MFKYRLFYLLLCAITLGAFFFISPIVAQVKPELSQPITTKKFNSRSHFRQLKAIIRLVLASIKDVIAWTMNVKIGDRLLKKN
jgi:hypothetical protein